MIGKGVPEKEVKSKDTCFLLIQQDWPRLQIDALMYDWNRIYEVVCFDKVAKVVANRTIVSAENTFKTLIAFQYSLTEEEPEQVYSIGDYKGGKF